jgi:hypothetical protein
VEPHEQVILSNGTILPMKRPTLLGLILEPQLLQSG